MKKTNYLIATCIILGVLIIINSCKKDFREQDQQSVQKITQWFESNIKETENSSFNKLTPQWDNINVLELSDRKIYEVGLDNPEKLLVMSNETIQSNLKEEEKRHSIRLLIFEDRKTGKILYACYMSIALATGQTPLKVHYNNVGKLTGTISYYTLNGVFANGWQFLDGKLDKTIKASSKLQYDAMMQKNSVDASGKLMDSGRSPYCLTKVAPRYRLGCVGVSGYEKCSYIFDGWDYTDICSYFDHDDGLTPSGYGEYYPPIKDCNGDDNGSAYFDNNCGCIGGNTGIVSCADIIDNLKDYPCAQNILKQLPILKNEIAELIKKTFGVNDVKNILFKTDKNLIGTNIDAKHSVGNFTPGITSSHTISLNPDVLNNSTREYILATMYHEVLHAYFAYKKQELGPTEFAKQFSGLTVNGGRLLFIEINDHFEMAASKYLYGLRDALLSYNRTLDAETALVLAKGGIVKYSKQDSISNANERDVTKGLFKGTKCP